MKNLREVILFFGGLALVAAVLLGWGIALNWAAGGLLKAGFRFLKSIGLPDGVSLGLPLLVVAAFVGWAVPAAAEGVAKSYRHYRLNRASRYTESG